MVVEGGGGYGRGESVSEWDGWGVAMGGGGGVGRWEVGSVVRIYR